MAIHVHIQYTQQTGIIRVYCIQNYIVTLNYSNAYIYIYTRCIPHLSFFQKKRIKWTSRRIADRNACHRSAISTAILLKRNWNKQNLMNINQSILLSHLAFCDPLVAPADVRWTGASQTWTAHPQEMEVTKLLESAQNTNSTNKDILDMLAMLDMDKSWTHGHVSKGAVKCCAHERSSCRFWGWAHPEVAALASGDIEMICLASPQVQTPRLENAPQMWC